MFGSASVPRIIQKTRVQLTHTKKKIMCEVQTHNPQPQVRGDIKLLPVVDVQVDVKHSRSSLRAMLAEKYVATLLRSCSIY